VNNFHVGLYFRALPETGGNDLVGRLSFYRDAPLPRKVAICVAGFARIGTNEKLLREISENLNMPCCVFNWAGLGNSKGDPGNFTISKALEDLQVAIEELKFMGFEEFYRSYNKKAFVKALQKLVPEILEDYIEPGGAGVRAQALEPDGKLVDDFKIVEAHKMVHVLNAPSPAATASLSIGKTIAELVKKKFEKES